MAKMKPHVPAKIKDPIAKSPHKLKRVPNPKKKKKKKKTQRKK